MKSTFSILVVSALAAVSLTAQAVEFNPKVRYSQAIIDNSIYGFKANMSDVCFYTFNKDGIRTGSETSDGKNKLDYVPGLVAKAVLEAVEYYDGVWHGMPEGLEKDELYATYAPWYYSIKFYGEAYYNQVSTTGTSLDDLNAVKLYFGLRNLSKPGATFASNDVYDHTSTALSRAATGLTATNNTYSIDHNKAGYTYATWAQDGAFDGGWWHKSGYPNQMWCDGQYMGPALLAQLLTSGYTLTDKTMEECWGIIAKQFELTWSKLWNPDTKLLYHAFSASPSETANRTSDWANATTGLSQEYWGRAEGWYFLALVDVIEQMPNGDARNSLISHLNDVAEGLKLKQHSSGCWYQLLNHDGNFSVDSYLTGSDLRNGPKSNYLESSCTAIFAAAYLKAIRLGYLDRDTYEETAKKAYQGLITNFWTGTKFIDCCSSAGLGGSSNSGTKTRDGSAAYYLLGSDVTINNDNEGKVIGAAILAAVEYERAYMPVNESCRCLRVRTNRP